ncbi:MAG TPA: malto-oligosyltrehalose trehalohydrolase [Terriglobales bacterium]|nr:malto-oligosyltrehalose trehalohydrolase [Terriglobales bacterium]
MPFGAECRDEGGARFRLWAPKAKSVTLRISAPTDDARIGDDASWQALPMAGHSDGWFEMVIDTANRGFLYQYLIDGGQAVPDPASRFQPAGVHGPSEVIDPRSYEWHDASWHGRPWREAVIYELHVGTFSAEGAYSGIEKKLDYLADLGVTAIELMPISSFPGRRNWGYDGVLPFAPTANYGHPDELKHLIDTAHAKNLMVLLDVVYNHFGPEGNYLWLYAPQFFTDRHHTPWGQAINFDGPESRAVRDYFIHNALYWLDEYHFDGLRLDAIHAIRDDSRPDILTELAETVRNRYADKRIVHLVLENDHNAAHYLQATHIKSAAGARSRVALYDAQWNDDIHHALHVLLTGERGAYYSDYADDPIVHLGRCLTEGFSYQGQTSQYRNGELRGEPSRDLPLAGFVNFLQNHDQVGNRAFGERINRLTDPAALRAAMAILLLAPSPPLLFMGEEFAAATPFLFFCDFGPELAQKVSEGRRSEYPQFMVSGESEIPDPNCAKTFAASKLDWSSIDGSAQAEWLRFYRTLLDIRRREIVPIIAAVLPGRAKYQCVASSAITSNWPLHEEGTLILRANLGKNPLRLEKPEGRLLYATALDQSDAVGELPPYSATWYLR